jgi:predicted xylose isomerase-like sugar epimerase
VLPAKSPASAEAVAGTRVKETAMRFMDRDEQRGLWYEELNRARQEIQNKWTEAERSHRRQLAECRQQALARALLLLPMNKSRARQLA